VKAITGNKIAVSTSLIGIFMPIDHHLHDNHHHYNNHHHHHHHHHDHPNIDEEVLAGVQSSFFSLSTASGVINVRLFPT
jgi:hypothetical protein